MSFTAVIFIRARDPQLSSVTRNCQIYSMQLDILNTGFFKLKEFLNFIIVRRNTLLNNECRSVSPNFPFKETRVVYFVTDWELSSSLYILLTAVMSAIFIGNLKSVIIHPYTIRHI